LLKELVPGAAPIAVLWDPGSRLSWQAVETSARQRGWKLLSFGVHDVAEIDAAIKAAAVARAGALLPVGGLAFRHARHIAEAAASSRLPAAYANPNQVGQAGLISYGADLDVIWRRAAVFVDKILKGTKPADLPVEQPTKFNLVINLKTARAIGLRIPQSLLLRADEVIQ
jgi:putative ABC transport system substrate-binding protein